MRNFDMRGSTRKKTAEGRGSSGRRKRWITPLILSFVVLLFSEEAAHAWGVGMHMMHGSTLLQNLQWLTGSLVQVLRAFPRDFLYGCVSADIFIGKGSKYHADHCHNWSTARRLLQQADDPSLQSFACGYIAHLAADIIAHNVYVPNQLYLTSSTTRLGHIYWELRADEFADQKYWKQVLDILSGANDQSDRFVQEIVKKDLVSFDMKKKLFTHAVKLYDLGKRQQAVSLVSRNSRWDVPQQYVQSLNRKCLNLIVNVLNHPEDSICYRYDPIGSQRLAEAKRLRQFSKRIHRKEPTDYIFDPPAEIESFFCCHAHSEVSSSVGTLRSESLGHIHLT
ncbi:MAG: zinc dependent phospholipase C family protein [Candidatus Manganitrophus sp. SA1]|nr:zinc dependent phospholipase C family protein [Candidatus Manganitrophus morganii]